MSSASGWIQTEPDTEHSVRGTFCIPVSSTGLGSVCLESAATQHSNPQNQPVSSNFTQEGDRLKPVEWHHFATDLKSDWDCTEEWISLCNSDSSCQRNPDFWAMEGNYKMYISKKLSIY